MGSRVELPVERRSVGVVDTVMTTAVRNATPTVKLGLAAVAAIIVFALVHAFAASLGAGTSGLGAGSTVLASCGNGMRFAYTTVFDTNISGYAVNGIDVSNIPAGCLSKSLSVTFTGGSGEVVGSTVAAALPASGTTQVVTVAASSNTIEAGLVKDVSVTVS